MTPKTSVLYLSATKIIVNGEDPAFGWNESNLEQILVEIKEKINAKSVRVLFDDSVSYLVNFPISHTPIARSEALMLVQKQIPERIESGYWDYKIDSNGEQTHLQAFVIKKDFLESVAKAFIDADLSIEASEPVSLSLARLTKQEPGAVVLVYNFTLDGGASYILCENGAVLSMIYSPENVTLDSVSRFISFCQQKYSVGLLKVLLKPDMLPQLTQISGIAIGHVQLDPFKAIIRKTDIKGEDEKVLNLDSTKLLKPMIMPVPIRSSLGGPDPKEEQDQISVKKTKIPFVFPIAFIVAMVAFVGFLIFSPAEQGTVEPTPILAPEPTLVPQINLNDYQFQILNGSGLAGEAANIRNLLGIDSAELANASNYDYEFTEVKLKPNLDNAVFEKILNLLKDTYEVKHSAQDLTEDSAYDVVLISGKKK